MTSRPNQQGFSILIVLLVAVVLVGLGGASYYVWSKNKDDTKKQSTTQKSENGPNDETDVTKKWMSAITANGRFEMKVPDGWKMTIYPGDYIGTRHTSYKAGTTAVIENSEVDYVGHSLRFRANITSLDAAGLGPQWESPQPGLYETSQAFSAGTLHGMRYKAVFSGDTNQILYEYVFDLGNNEKLDIVYSVDSVQNESDNVDVVERAISTIKLNQTE